MTMYTALRVSSSGKDWEMDYKGSTVEEIRDMVNKALKSGFFSLEVLSYIFVLRVEVEKKLGFGIFLGEKRFMESIIADVIVGPKSLKGRTVAEMFEWIDKQHQEKLNIPKGTQYEFLVVATNGEFKIVTKGNTIEEVWNNWEKIDGSKYLEYPYFFVITAHKGDIENVLEQTIVDIDPGAEMPFDFMEGWKVKRAIKKIVAENKKLEEESEDPLLWGLE